MIRINLAPPRPRRSALTVPTVGLGALFGGLFLVAALGVGGYWLVLWREEARLTAEIARMAQELGTLRQTIGQNAGLREKVTDLRRRVATIQQLTRNQSYPIRLLDAFVTMAPPDLWITAMEEKNEAVKITGSAFSPAAVSDFMNNLRASGRFKDVDILTAREDLGKTPRLVIFEVMCRFEA